VVPVGGLEPPRLSTGDFESMTEHIRLYISINNITYLLSKFCIKSTSN
jgi:hypothetical protein